MESFYKRCSVSKGVHYLHCTNSPIENQKCIDEQEALLKPISKSGKLFNLCRKYGKLRNRRILPIMPLFGFGKVELEFTNIKMGPTRSVLLIIHIYEVELFLIK
jgi:hypothetical protein